jgi:hypothetical membrane protein
MTSVSLPPTPPVAYLFLVRRRKITVGTFSVTSNPNDFEPHMERDYRLLFGPMAGAILALGIAGLALMIPGYNHVHQTVSEIGEIGSPARFPFAIMLCCVAACILVFAAAVRDRSVEAGHSRLAAYLIGFMALPAAGTGVFAYPHPLHNIFGIFELIGYQAPLFLALTWRRDPRARVLVSLSWILYVVVCVAIALNLSSLDRQGLVWAYVKPVHGLTQRALFAAWFGWCAVVGLLLFQMKWPRPSIFDPSPNNSGSRVV